MVLLMFLGQNLNKFGLNWTVWRVQQVSGLGDACVASLGIFAAQCGVPGDILTNMFGTSILIWAPDKASASTLWHSQKGLLQCVTNNMPAESCHSKLTGGKHPHLVFALWCPSS